MQFRTIAVLVVLTLIALFAVLNWSAIMAPTTLSLAVTTVQAPLGLIMLGLIAILTTIFLGFIVYLQSTVLLESRRQAKELTAQRTLADQAEASRFTELQNYAGGEFGKLAARLDKLDADQRAALEQTGNTLAAYIGELEDRLERGGKS